MPVTKKLIEETGNEKLRKAIDFVYELGPGPKQWVATRDLWLSLNAKEKLPNGQIQSAKEAYALTVADNKRIRATRANVFASNSDKSMRYAAAIPAGLVYMLELFDPMIFQGKAAKKNLAKMSKVLPELFIPERY